MGERLGNAEHALGGHAPNKGRLQQVGAGLLFVCAASRCGLGLCLGAVLVREFDGLVVGELHGDLEAVVLDGYGCVLVCHDGPRLVVFHELGRRACDLVQAIHVYDPNKARLFVGDDSAGLEIVKNVVEIATADA